MVLYARLVGIRPVLQDFVSNIQGLSYTKTQGMLDEPTSFIQELEYMNKRGISNIF